MSGHGYEIGAKVREAMSALDVPTLSALAERSMELEAQIGERDGVIAELRELLRRKDRQFAELLAEALGGVPYPQSLMARYQQPLALWQADELPCDDKDKQTLRVALGACEELGEVARCVLKRSQGIRGDGEEWRGKASGEIGDVCVYLMQLCTLLGFDFEQCIHEAASKVLARTGDRREVAP